MENSTGIVRSPRKIPPIPGVSCERVLRKHYILHFILHGKGTFRQGNESYPVTAGQAFLITPDIFCSYIADKEDPWAYIWVEFDGLSARDYLNQAGISRSCPIYTGVDQPCTEYLSRMIDHHDSLLQVEAYLLLVFDKLISNCPQEHSPAYAEATSEVYVRHAMKYIDLNYWKNPTIQELANFCGINRSHLSRIFKQKNQSESAGISAPLSNQYGLYVPAYNGPDPFPDRHGAGLCGSVFLFQSI